MNPGEFSQKPRCGIRAAGIFTNDRYSSTCTVRGWIRNFPSGIITFGFYPWRLPGCNYFVYSVQRFIEFIRVWSSGLGHIRPAAATAADKR